MNLSAAIDRFLLLQAARGNTPGTIKTYEVVLRQTLARVGNVRMRDVTTTHMEDVFYGPKGFAERQSASTLNNNRGRLVVFFRWAQGERLTDADPMRTITSRRVLKREFQRLTPEEMISAIEAATYPRDRAAVAIACNTGMRASSIAALRVGDLDLDAGTLKYLNVKSKRERTQPVSTELDSELRRWLLHYRTECAHLVEPLSRQRYGLREDWFLVPARKVEWAGCGAPTTHRSRLYPDRPLKRPSDLVHRVLGEIGMDGKREGFHTFRRSAGRAVFEAAIDAGDPRAIHIAQSFLDHEQASTTQLYIGTSHEAQKLDEMLRGKRFLTRHAKPAPTDNVVIDLASRRRGG